jgi:hypothetical protein
VFLMVMTDARDLGGKLASSAAQSDACTQQQQSVGVPSGEGWPARGRHRHKAVLAACRPQAYLERRETEHKQPEHCSCCQQDEGPQEERLPGLSPQLLCCLGGC